MKRFQDKSQAQIQKEMKQMMAKAIFGIDIRFKGVHIYSHLPKLV
jgi:hypothetical protein